jgi:hypothetical protein
MGEERGKRERIYYSELVSHNITHNVKMVLKFKAGPKEECNHGKVDNGIVITVITTW